jgi:hypothetical protein
MRKGTSAESAIQDGDGPPSHSTIWNAPSALTINNTRDPGALPQARIEVAPLALRGRQRFALPEIALGIGLGRRASKAKQIIGKMPMPRRRLRELFHRRWASKMLG